jgi:3-oxoacyl-[acyl-carrier protein] reductase
MGMTMTLTKDWGQLIPAVICVAYGFIKTRLTEATADGNAAAGAVYLFGIPESDYVSGQTLVCSGGLTGT